VTFGPGLTTADAALFETFVVPRYLAFFGGIACDMLIPHASAVVAHLGCRTGYPDGLVAERLPHSTLVGVDSSAAAVDLARTKAALVTGFNANYHIAEALPTPLGGEGFTHALSIHPLCNAETRNALLAELRRVLIPGGQALLSLPLRGSFPEINDMIREFALRQDLADVSKAVDNAAASRPTLETVAEEFEQAGFGEVDVDVQLIAVSFGSGREFLEDPIARFMVLPDVRENMSIEPQLAEASFKYVRDAIAKYWSEGVFELTINVGCASARRS
jgi:SAM-dependent methyltransferase